LDPALGGGDGGGESSHAAARDHHIDHVLARNHHRSLAWRHNEIREETMRRTVFSFALAAVVSVPAMAGTKIEVTLFAGSGSLPLYVAADAGLFAKEGLTANLTATPSSGALIQGLIAGKYQFAYAGVDNYIAYDEGQGTSPTEKTPDIVII